MKEKYCHKNCTNFYRITNEAGVSVQCIATKPFTILRYDWDKEKYIRCKDCPLAQQKEVNKAEQGASMEHKEDV